MKVMCLQSCSREWLGNFKCMRKYFVLVQCKMQTVAGHLRAIANLTHIHLKLFHDCSQAPGCKLHISHPSPPIIFQCSPTAHPAPLQGSTTRLPSARPSLHPKCPTNYAATSDSQQSRPLGVTEVHGKMTISMFFRQAQVKA